MSHILMLKPTPMDLYIKVNNHVSTGQCSGFAKHAFLTAAPLCVPVLTYVEKIQFLLQVITVFHLSNLQAIIVTQWPQWKN